MPTSVNLPIGREAPADDQERGAPGGNVRTKRTRRSLRHERPGTNHRSTRSVRQAAVAKPSPDDLRPIEIRPNSRPEELFLSSSADIAIIAGTKGSGKLLGLNTRVPTPGGWTTVGDLRVGDTIFGRDGKPCKVEWLSDIDKEPESYRLLLDDGSSFDACADHLWLTFDIRERDALGRRNEEWRRRRRERRSSRAKETTPWLFRLLPICIRPGSTRTKPAPTGTVRTTKQIANSLVFRRAKNHAIPIAHPIELPEAKAPLDPYVLGAWLGDGNTREGVITSADQQVIQELEGCGWKCGKIPSAKYGWRVHGLNAPLRKLGLLGSKHVPAIYLRGSISQRTALLQGLMDTDGCANRSGTVEFTSTKFELASAVHELACSLGQKPTIREGRAKLNGKDYGPKWRVSWSPSIPVFRLKRKLARLKLQPAKLKRFRYVVSCERMAPVPMRCIRASSTDHLFLVGDTMVPTHNSWPLLMEPLRHIHTVPGFGGVIFRRERPQITNEGGLLDTSSKIYPRLPLGQRGILRQTDLDWTFPPYGNRIKFAHMEQDNDRFKWDGSQIPFIGFDQLESFTSTVFFYLLTCNRSVCGVRPYVRANCNPPKISNPEQVWLREFVSWWINDETGYAIPERSGVIRWMVNIGDELIWADTSEELVKRFGPLIHPMSVTFIPSKIYDNKTLLEHNPEYLAKLQILTRAERERLLGDPVLGANWNVAETAGSFFNREDLGIVKEAPAGKDVRYWDRAATQRPANDTKHSATAGVRMRSVPVGSAYMYYIVDVCRFFGSAHEVADKIKNVASQDGRSVTVGLEQDPGQAGKAEVEDLARQLAGYDVVINAVRESKGVRATPYARQAQAGNVKLKEGAWNENFIREHENFDGTDKCISDQVDGADGAFYLLTRPSQLIGAW